MNENDDITTRRVRESDLWTITEPGIPLFMSVTLTIKPERREEFLAALREVLPSARAEESCVYLHVGESAAVACSCCPRGGWTSSSTGTSFRGYL